MKATSFLVIFAVLALLATKSLADGLEITEIDVNVDYDESYIYKFEDKDRVNSVAVPVANNSKIGVDILPGSNLTFEIKIGNSFKSEGSELKDVSAKITIEDIDGSDIEEDSAEFDLDPGDEQRFDIKFFIPLNVDAGTYNTIIEAIGEDKNETSYETVVNLKLEIKKQKHDIRITKVLLNPPVVECSRKAKLSGEITNLGTNPENEVALEFKATALGINSFDKSIVLESSEDSSEEERKYSKSLNIELPSFFKSGAYPILINTYWKNYVLFDQKTVELTVKDCSSSGISKTEPKSKEIRQDNNEGGEEVVLIQPKDGSNEVGSNAQKIGIITATKELSVWASPQFFLVFSLGVIVMSLIILVGLVYFVKRNKFK